MVHRNKHNCIVSVQAIFTRTLRSVLIVLLIYGTEDSLNAVIASTESVKYLVKVLQSVCQ